MESTSVATDVVLQEHIRTAHETIDRFAAAYPNAVQSLCAWIAAQLPAGNESGTLPDQASAKPCSGSRFEKSVAALERSDILSAVIKAAQATALDPSAPRSVWAVIVRMAEAKDKPAPLIGFSSDGIQYAGQRYQDEGIADVLTFKNLADRIRRRRKATRG